MALETKICSQCNKEKNVSDFYRYNKYVYATCIECWKHLRKIKRELQIKKENEKKQKEKEKEILLKLFYSNKSLKGTYKLYYDYFCKKIKYYNGINIRLSEKYAFQDLKKKFKLNPKFAISLLENQFKGKGILEIDYEKNYIRSKI